MNALILDGTQVTDGRLRHACDVMESGLQKGGMQVERLRLCDLKIAQCCGRFNCWLQSPGRCTTKDDGRRIGQAMIYCDLLILVTPVSFGGYGSLLKGAMDRCLPALLPFFEKYKGEVHHPLRGGRARRLVVLGGLPGPDPDSEAVFQQVVGRNALNMRSPDSLVAFVRDDEGDAVAERVALQLLDTLGVKVPEVIK